MCSKVKHGESVKFEGNVPFDFSPDCVGLHRSPDCYLLDMSGGVRPSLFV
jgi:hypothetical protein